jgi:hypothetical protein
MVDDEIDARDLVKQLLGMAGATVWTVGSASEAMEHILARRPDVLVCDIGMQEEDGHGIPERGRRCTFSSAVVADRSCKIHSAIPNQGGVHGLGRGICFESQVGEISILGSVGGEGSYGCEQPRPSGFPRARPQATQSQAL